MLSEKTKQLIIKLQQKYPQKRSALIPALHLAQAEAGYLPREIQNEIAALFDLEPNEVNAVVTFYDMFYENPIGKHIIHVCKNASCMLRGSDELIDVLCSKLQIAPGQTTSDGQFTVIPCECMGACDKAPMILLDDKVLGPVDLNELDSILSTAKQMPGHPSPMCLTEGDHV